LSVVHCPLSVARKKAIERERLQQRTTGHGHLTVDYKHKYLNL
jgi:hypothetical protein